MSMEWGEAAIQLSSYRQYIPTPADQASPYIVIVTRAHDHVQSSPTLTQGVARQAGSSGPTGRGMHPREGVGVHLGEQLDPPLLKPAPSPPSSSPHPLLWLEQGVQLAWIGALRIPSVCSGDTSPTVSPCKIIHMHTPSDLRKLSVTKLLHSHFLMGGLRRGLVLVRGFFKIRFPIGNRFKRFPLQTELQGSVLLVTTSNYLESKAVSLALLTYYS